jgi:hypothetical protein
MSFQWKSPGIVACAAGLLFSAFLAVTGMTFARAGNDQTPGSSSMFFKLKSQEQEMIYDHVKERRSCSRLPVQYQAVCGEAAYNYNLTQ